MTLKRYGCNGCHFEIWVNSEGHDMREAYCPFGHTITHKHIAVGMSPVDGREVIGIVEIV